jgi:hypothetical protein
VQLHEDVLPELVAVRQGQAGGAHHVLRVVAAGVEDGGADQLAQIGTVPEVAV